MAPAKTSRRVNKEFSLSTEISLSKDGSGDNGKKSLQRKRKLSDMLGPQWNKEDLTHFYQAYRKYGKDWKKVAAAVKPRTAEMVEALYTTNRAYLSLPEGNASVIGLIAMMTDHYCNLAASDSEQESNDNAGTSRKPQKRARVKIQPNVSKTSEMASPTLAATPGRFTLLKKQQSGGSRPRAVGKRTPRFPMSFSFENPKDEMYSSPSRRSLKLKRDDTDDDMKLPLVLTEAENNSKTSLQVHRKNKKVLFRRDEHPTFDALQTLADMSVKLATAENEDESLIQANDEFDDRVDESDSLEAVPANKQRNKEAKEASNKSTNKGKRSFQSASSKSIKDQEHSSGADPRTERSDSAQSTAHIPVAKQMNLPTKVRSRRKTDVKKPQRQKDFKIPDQHSVQKNISNCLSKHQVRSWCTYEWFYSAIDYPWFAKREFVEYLRYVGLGHVPRLTRAEWSVIRSSLGKPRRLSKQFLNEEKEKLNQYRESARTHYTELHKGNKEGPTIDLARPLSVGQRVIAIHPQTREIHDGCVLTIDHSRCCVQFDQPELGVEFVMDTDCMPLNPFENMPTLLTRRADAVDKFFESFNEHKVNVRGNGYMDIPAGDNRENGDAFSHFSPPGHPISDLLKQTKVASAEADMQYKSGVTEITTYQLIENSKCSPVAQIQAKEADVQALAKLTRALDKKDAVVSELRRMNDDMSENQNKNDCYLRESEPFREQCAAVLIQLNEVNEQVSSALYHLRQRNTYQPHESGFLVKEIIESSKIRARTMVDAALQAMLSISGRDDTTENIEEAIDYVNDRIPLHDSPPDMSKNMLDRNEAEIPSELITKCVATLLMIQKCTERQFPLAGVAEVLDSAVASLQPCCSQNIPVYGEIQKCMGIIRNQILALIPA